MTIRIHRHHQAFAYYDVPKENIPPRLLSKIARLRGFDLGMKISRFLNKFFRRNPSLSETDFEEALLGRYAPLTARMAGLHGYTVNFRDPDQESAMRGFFPEEAWGFSDEGRTHRQAFCALWDGAAELFFDSVDAFRAARGDTELHAELSALEGELFEAVWYVEVDENIIVMPNRDPAPEFYYR